MCALGSGALLLLSANPASACCMPPLLPKGLGRALGAAWPLDVPSFSESLAAASHRIVICWLSAAAESADWELPMSGTLLPPLVIVSPSVLRAGRGSEWPLL